MFPSNDILYVFTWRRISQGEVIRQHSVEYVALQQPCKGESNHVVPLNAVDEWQCNRLTYQIDVHICSQCVWYNHKSVMGIYILSKIMTPGVGSLYQGCKQFDCLCSPGFLLTNKQSDEGQAPHHRHIVRTLFHQKEHQLSIPSSNELLLETTGVAYVNGLESLEYTLKGAFAGIRP
ncbi:hypothetical protein TNCV_918211 [Trichonephila clavipes]|nr:hypothetical protein TNCV_918211 [Trichonephila clavipes]